ncbi:MAG: hypothetical protein ABTD50_03040 [Polyangiaceae bacterium]
MTDATDRGHDVGMGKLRLLLGVVLVGCGGEVAPTVPVPALGATADAMPAQDGTAVVSALDATAVDATPSPDAAANDGPVTPEVDAEDVIGDSGGDLDAIEPPYAIDCGAPPLHRLESCANADMAAGTCELDWCTVALADAGGRTYYCCFVHTTVK